eukprot:g81261.t1
MCKVFFYVFLAWLAILYRTVAKCSFLFACVLARMVLPLLLWPLPSSVRQFLLQSVYIFLVRPSIMIAVVWLDLFPVVRQSMGSHIFVSCIWSKISGRTTESVGIMCTQFCAWKRLGPAPHLVSIPHLVPTGDHLPLTVYMDLHFSVFPWTHHFLFYSEQLLACYSSMEFLGVRIWGNWTSVPAPKEDCPLNPVDVYQYVYDREWQEALEVGGHVGFMDWGMSKRIEKTRLGAQALGNQRQRRLRTCIILWSELLVIILRAQTFFWARFFIIIREAFKSPTFLISSTHLNLFNPLWEGEPTRGPFNEVPEGVGSRLLLFLEDPTMSRELLQCHCHRVACDIKENHLGGF